VRLTICTVGRLKAGPERDLIAKYTKRVQWPLEIIEVEERRKLSPAELRNREGELLSGWVHLLPFRTEKLSQLAQMVLPF